MRPSCLDCVIKHLAQAIVLMKESRLGYTIHKWLAIGHLAEAEEESISKYPELAAKIKEARNAIDIQGILWDVFIEAIDLFDRD